MLVEICIPAYNEAAILTRSAEFVLNYCENNLKDYNWQIILLINGSSDNSPSLAKDLENKYQHISALVYAEPGRGRALRKYWLNSRADILVYMDSDLAVKLSALEKLIEPLVKNRSDISIGSRFHPEAKVERSFFREFISRGYSLVSRGFLGNPQKDLQCGFKAITASAFRQLANKATAPDWFFDTELIVWGNRLGLRIAEIPVDWRETRFGKRPSTVRLFLIPIQFIKPLWQLRKKLRNT